MTADLDKILETLERQNEMIASLKAENEQLKAVQEHEQPQEQPQANETEPKKQGFWEAVENIPEAERYKAVADFVARCDYWCKQEYERLLAEHNKACKQRIAKATKELESLEKSKPNKLFQGAKFREWEAKVQKARKEKNYAKSLLEDFPPTAGLKAQATENFYKNSKTPELTRLEIDKARIFLREHKLGDGAKGGLLPSDRPAH